MKGIPAFLHGILILWMENVDFLFVFFLKNHLLESSSISLLLPDKHLDSISPRQPYSFLTPQPGPMCVCLPMDGIQSPSELRTRSVPPEVSPPRQQLTLPFDELYGVRGQACTVSTNAISCQDSTDVPSPPPYDWVNYSQQWKELSECGQKGRESAFGCGHVYSSAPPVSFALLAGSCHYWCHLDKSKQQDINRKVYSNSDCTQIETEPKKIKKLSWS